MPTSGAVTEVWPRGQEGSRIPRILPFVFLVRSMWASLDLAWVLEYAVHPYPHEVSTAGRLPPRAVERGLGVEDH